MTIISSAPRSRWRAKPHALFLLGGTLVAAACSDAAVPVPIGGAGVGGSLAGSGGSANSGGSASGTAGSGTTVAGSGGAGIAGGGGGAAGTGGGGTAGTGGANGSGGSAGTGVNCPIDGGAGGAEADDPNPTGDSDGDGTANCLDDCPADAFKTAPGECGCGTVDYDADSDGTFDCEDECDIDPLKTVPGTCGCGLSDTANADNDAAVDCLDACPKDPALTAAGSCGCLPDSLGALCLAHRYQLDGDGAVVVDAIAGAAGNGVAVGATLSGAGTLVLTGGASDQYVKLPAGMISALGNSATFEAWVTWTGTGGDWQRIFDFGSSDLGADQQGNGNGYFFLTPRAASGALRVAVSPAGNGEEDLVDAAAALPSTTMAHVAVVVSGSAQTLALYLNGVSQGTPAPIRPAAALSRLNDVNNWLGRSQWAADEELAGTYHEFRVYSRALAAEQIGASFAAGPDTLAP